MEALGEETDKSPVWKADFRVKTRYLLCSSGFSGCVEHARTHYAKWLNSSKPDAGMPYVKIYKNKNTEEKIVKKNIMTITAGNLL